MDNQTEDVMTVSLVSEESEITGIRDLQEKNLLKNLTKEEAASQGFVTAEYSIEFLEAMHRSAPSVIAKDGDQVVGFAIVTTREVGLQHDLLADLIRSIDKITYKNQLLRYSKYVIVGQLCVAKNYRGLGLVPKMYALFKSSLSAHFDYCLTDVAEDNPRSLKAHIKTGFQVIDTLHYGGFGWDIVLWDWA